jgi:hypothetical protein
MSKFSIAASLFGLVLAGSALQADVWNKKTKVTFNTPVEIPGPHTQNGVIALTPGTYVFRLVDSNSDRHIVEVTNAAETKVISTILTINDYRLNASSKTVMYFSERASGAPPALKSWFYPGDNFGQRFIYPKPKAVQLATVLNEPVPSHNETVIEKTKYVAVPIYIQTPAKKEVAYDSSTLAKNDSDDAAGVDGEAVKPAAAPAEKLPKTASDLPLIAIFGFSLFALSLLSRRLAAMLG